MKLTSQQREHLIEAMKLDFIDIATGNICADRITTLIESWLGEARCPEPEWLDAESLDRLPRLSVIIGRNSSHPMWKDDGRWRYLLSGHQEHMSSRAAAPARLLWAGYGHRSDA